MNAKRHATAPHARMMAERYTLARAWRSSRLLGICRLAYERKKRPLPRPNTLGVNCRSSLSWMAARPCGARLEARACIRKQGQVAGCCLESGFEVGGEVAMPVHGSNFNSIPCSRANGLPAKARLVRSTPALEHLTHRPVGKRAPIRAPCTCPPGCINLPPCRRACGCHACAAMHVAAWTCRRTAVRVAGRHMHHGIHVMARHGTAWHGMARYGMTQHGMAWHGTAWHGMTWHGMARHGMAWHGTARHGMRARGGSTYSTIIAKKSGSSRHWTFVQTTVSSTPNDVKTAPPPPPPPPPQPLLPPPLPHPPSNLPRRGGTPPPQAPLTPPSVTACVCACAFACRRPSCTAPPAGAPPAAPRMPPAARRASGALKFLYIPRRANARRVGPPPRSVCRCASGRAGASALIKAPGRSLRQLLDCDWVRNVWTRARATAARRARFPRVCWAWNYFSSLCGAGSGAARGRAQLLRTSDLAVS
eukprot:356753-Chlamydomonas_euryale.AAC.4